MSDIIIQAESPENFQSAIELVQTQETLETSQSATETSQSATETPPPHETPEPATPQPTDTPQLVQPKLEITNDTIFKVQKYLFDYDEFVKKLGKSEDVQFRVDGEMAEYFSGDKVYMRAKWHLLAEYKNAEDGIVILWAWAHPDAETTEQCELSLRMRNAFSPASGLEILNHASVKFNDPMMLNIIMAYAYEITGAQMVSNFNSIDDTMSVIFAFTDVVFE